MVEKYTLRNGIPVFIVESHASPVVSIQAWIKRGSAYESEKIAGISHFLEHALFKGTKKRQVGEIALEIESRGGEINAFTSFEETAYYATLASRYFADGLDVIADAVQNPLFDEEEMNREREVILEEIKRAHDSPFKMVSTNMWSTLFSGTPYGRPVLGFEKTVRHINHKTLREYFQRHYHAGSAAVFIVGDVSAREAHSLAQKKFGTMRRGKNVELPKTLKFKKIGSPKVVSIARDMSECHLQVGFSAPGITASGIPAIDLMASAVGQGESSRLYQRLVKDKKLALEVHMGLTATSRCGMTTISVVATPDKVEPALRECMDVIAEAAETGLDEREIERVKSSLEAEVVGGKETVEGYARRLGYYYCQFGDPEYEKKYLERVFAIDREEASHALCSQFGQKPVLSIAHPKAHAIDKNALADALSRRPPKKPTARPIVTGPELANRGSLRFVTKAIETLPIVTVRILFPGGSREETPGKLGVAHLFQRLWTSGTTSFSSLQIAETLESLGASVNGFAGRNTLGLSIEFLSKQWPVVKPLLSEILLEPTFPEDEFATEKGIALREIASEKDSPGQLCHLNFLSVMYGEHPYGRSPLGTRETVSSLTTADLKQYYRDYVHKRHAVISTVGHFTKDSWINELEQLCDALPASGRDPSVALPIPVASSLRVKIDRKEPLHQSHVMVGFLGATLSSPERYALKLLSSCLAGQGGRLFLELRDRQSLAYQVAPISSDSPEPGIFAFYIGCSPEKVDKSLTGIRGEIEKILNEPMSAKELDRAKKYWIGRFELEMQRFAAQAMLFGLDEVYGLGYAHSQGVPDLVKSLTANEIREAAQRYLKVDSATISIVHNEELPEDRVREAWGVRRERASQSAKLSAVEASK